MRLQLTCSFLHKSSQVDAMEYLNLCRVVIGYDEGTIMIKIGREVPVASMDSSGKIIWAKHNEIQTVNIKSVGADNEVTFLHHAITM